MHTNTFLKRLTGELLVLAVIVVLVGCATKPPSPFVVSQTGKPGGWLSDGSQLMISRYGRQPLALSADDPSFPVVASHWDFSKASGECSRLSPDGTAVLYIEYEPRPNSNSLANLYLLNRPGIRSSLVMTATYMSCPSWSPDSQNFVVAFGEGHGHTLRVFERSISNYRDLYNGAAVLLSSGPTWSPNGHLIVATERDQIIFVDVATGQRVQTGSAAIDGIEATWAPNSQYIAYIGMEGDARNLVAIKIDGTQKQTLAGVQGTPQSGDYLFSSPMWSPRGDYIAVQRIPAGVHDLQQRYEKAEVVLISIPESLKQAATH